MDQFSRRIVGFAVRGGTLDGPATCRIFNRIVSGSGAPRYLSSDNDPLFLYHQWNANLRILDVTEVKTVPYVPLSHPLRTVFTEDSTALLPTNIVKSQIERSLAWMIIVGKNAAVVCVSYRLRLEY